MTSSLSTFRLLHQIPKTHTNITPSSPSSVNGPIRNSATTITCSTVMTLLAAPRTGPGVSLSRQTDVISTLSPIVQSALQFQQLIGSAAFHLFVRTYFAATLVATTSLWATKGIVWRTIFATRLLAARTLDVTRRLVWALWDSRRGRRLRKRIEFELFVLILGPGGNALFLMLFWPGWLMLAFLAWGLWQFTG